MLYVKYTLLGVLSYQYGMERLPLYRTDLTFRCFFIVFPRFTLRCHQLHKFYELGKKPISSLAKQDTYITT